jgi:hypothetical protein
MRTQVVLDGLKEALIYSEPPRHMDVRPFSVADKPLKMKENEKSHFSILLGLSMPSSLRDRLTPFKISPYDFVAL